MESKISKEKAVLYGKDGCDFRVLRELTTQRVIDDHSDRVYNAGDFLWLLQNNPNLESFGGSFFLGNGKEYEEIIMFLERDFKIYRIQSFSGWFSDGRIAKTLLRNIRIRYYAEERALQLLMMRKYRANFVSGSECGTGNENGVENGVSGVENVARLGVLRVNEMSEGAVLLAWVPKELVLQMAKQLYQVALQEQRDLHLKRLNLK
jgi:hypothetical protein